LFTTRTGLANPADHTRGALRFKTHFCLYVSFQQLSRAFLMARSKTTMMNPSPVDPSGKTKQRIAFCTRCLVDRPISIDRREGNEQYITCLYCGWEIFSYRIVDLEGNPAPGDDHEISLSGTSTKSIFSFYFVLEPRGVFGMTILAC
nr:hypothetical protein [Candidatus Sigynarchaeota archaeon]